MLRDKIINFLKVFCFFLVFCAIFSMVTKVLRDKRIEGEYNPTTKVKGFYEEEKDSLDIVFVGSSQLYAHVIPAVLWRDYGITSYDFAANEQPLWISYYYIKEALKRQEPKAIVLEVFTAYGDDLEEEGVNHINLDDLPMSLNKLQAIYYGTPKELWYSYIFDVAKYHTTWSSVDRVKYEASFQKEPDLMKGYSPFLFEREYELQAKSDVVNQQNIMEMPERAKKWLLKIKELCDEEQVDLIFLKTPNGNSERQMLYNSVASFANEQQIPFLNLNVILDGEAHINILQAEKVTGHVGDYLSSLYTFSDDDKSESVKESFDKSMALIERYKKKCQLYSAKDYDTYVDLLRDDKFCVLVVKKPSQNDKSAGIWIYDGGKIAYENVSNVEESAQLESVQMEYQYDLGDKIVMLKAGDDSSILIDDLNYSMNEDGYNLLVIDRELDEIVEMVAFQVENDMKMLRK